jgi:hypothetical protein
VLLEAASTGGCPGADAATNLDPRATNQEQGDSRYGVAHSMESKSSFYSFILRVLCNLGSSMGGTWVQSIYLARLVLWRMFCMM